ncbi:RidA family protein [Streptomyces sp. NPDC052727]|uniref:RidA family protein n=1 Tax=Streptomyces sp. NPDC052727 TaxID=3154854 RepID=UPI0034224C5D
MSEPPRGAGRGPTHISAPAGVFPAAQYTHVVFANLRRCLAAAGAGFEDVVKLTYFLTDMAHMPAIRAARAAHMPDDRLPASSAVRVAPEFLLEVEALPLPKSVGVPPAVVAE